MDSFKNLTTFKVGGGIAHIVRAESAPALIQVVADLTVAREPFLIMGGGSNILANDADYAGTVVIPSFAKITFQNETMIADAGASWDAVVSEANARGLWGIENLSGIPGTVGGAVVANIGAYGAALSDTLVSVEVYDNATSTRRTLSLDECGLGYRVSVFKQNPERHVILSATFSLSKMEKPNLAYRDLSSRFAGSLVPGLLDIRKAVLAIRAKKFPSLSEYGTAGSFFLNPIVSPRDVTRLAEIYPSMPFFTLPEGGVKLPLAWILDHVVHAKGMREGHAFVWEAQPLCIATDMGATARDVRALAERIAQTVKEKTNLRVTPEVRVL